MSLYKQKSSDVWYADLRYAGGRVRRSTGETDRAAAQKRANEIQVELWALVPNVKGHTWGEAVIAWLEVEPRSDSELLSLAKFGRGYPDRALADVTRDNVHEALAFCRTAGTYMRYRTMIAAILNLAKLAGWLPNPPLLAVKRDKKTKRRVWLTPEQWLALRAELPEHLKPPASFALATGLRQDNVLGLEWSRVDLDRRLVWVEADEMKADQAIAIPLSDEAVAILAAQQRRPAYRPARGRGEPVVSAYVFPFRGKRIGDIKTAFIPACIRAGLGAYEADEDGVSHYRGFTWHGLRHTWATWHKQNGTPDEALQQLGGWSDPRMVQTYAHHAPGFAATYVNNTRKTE
jgi:integrase